MAESPFVMRIRGAAWNGEPCAWADRFDTPAPAAARGVELAYNTRRLDEMVAYALAASFEAIARAGWDRATLEAAGVVGLSHNGPCIYSEEFYRQLCEEENPALVSPTLFVESVLNVACTHLTLAMKTHRPAFALNTDLAHSHEVFHTLALLFESGQMARAVYFACDEFSTLGRALFAACPEFPGEQFVGGAGALALEAVHGSGPDEAGGLLLTRWHSVASFDALQGTLDAAGLADAVRIWSPWSDAPPPPAWPGSAAEGVSGLGAALQQREQGFASMRLAEVLDAAAQTPPGGTAVLVQALRGRLGWLAIKKETGGADAVPNQEQGV